MVNFVHFWGFLSYKLQRTCNVMVKLKWCWFHSKVFILGQVMVKKWCDAHIWTYCFWPLTQQVLGKLDCNLSWELRRQYYLSVGDKKSNIWICGLFLIFDFWTPLGQKMGMVTTHARTGPGTPNSTKTLVHLSGQPLSRNHVCENFRGEPACKQNLMYG